MKKPFQGDNVYRSRPFIPIGVFKNNGVSDVAGAEGLITFEHIATGTIVEVPTVIEDIASGRYNIKDERFPITTLDLAGQWRATLSITADGEFDLSNNQMSVTFNVLPTQLVLLAITKQSKLRQMIFTSKVCLVQSNLNLLTQFTL